MFSTSSWPLSCSFPPGITNEATLSMLGLGPYKPFLWESCCTGLCSGRLCVWVLGGFAPVAFLAVASFSLMMINADLDEI